MRKKAIPPSSLLEPTYYACTLVWVGFVKSKLFSVPVVTVVVSFFPFLVLRESLGCFVVELMCVEKFPAGTSCFNTGGAIAGLRRESGDHKGNYSGMIVPPLLW